LTQLPEDWRWVSLDDVAAPVPNAIVDGPFGSNLKLSDYVEDGVPVLQGKNVTDDKFRWLDVRFISERKAEELKRSSVRPGDILLVKIGSIGYSAVLDGLNGYDCAVIPANLAKITPNSAVVHTPFLHRWLTSPQVKDYLVRSASQTAQPALSLGKIKRLPVPLPPLPEQRRIAAILDRADELRAKRRVALEQLKGLTQAIFLEMFGDPVANPKGWSRQSLNSVCDKITDGEHLNPQFSTSGMPIVMAGEVLDDKINLADAKRVEISLGDRFRRKCNPERGDVLLVSRGATIGRSCVVDTDDIFCLMGSVILIKPDREKLESEYLSASLKHPALTNALKRASGSSAQGAIYIKDLKNLPVLVPPLCRQSEMAIRLAEIKCVKSTFHSSLAHLDTLFISLQYRAFSGELWQ
jgi:type I restriction enzyme S subunit